MVVGDGAIGKTCLMIRSLLHNPDTHKTTLKMTTRLPSSKIKPKESPLEVCLSISVCGMTNSKLRDTAGQEDYGRLRPLAYPNTDVFVIAFAVVEPGSFVNAKKLV